MSVKIPPQWLVCYVTNNWIEDHDEAFFTYEFDAYVSKEGYDKVMKLGKDNGNPEWKIMYKEWSQ